MLKEKATRSFIHGDIDRYTILMSRATRVASLATLAHAASFVSWRSLTARDVLVFVVYGGPALFACRWLAFRYGPALDLLMVLAVDIGAFVCSVRSQCEERRARSLAVVRCGSQPGWPPQSTPTGFAACIVKPDVVALLLVAQWWMLAETFPVLGDWRGATWGDAEQSVVRDGPGRTSFRVLDGSAAALSASVLWGVLRCSCSSVMSRGLARRAALLGVSVTMMAPDAFMNPDSPGCVLLICALTMHSLSCEIAKNAQVKSTSALLLHLFPAAVLLVDARYWYTARAVAFATGAVCI
jgi:hypothetical protein